MMDVATAAAFERTLAKVMAHPLAAMAPAGSEAMVRAAALNGLTQEQARKVRRALDTASERQTALQIITILGVPQEDAILLLTWVLAEVTRVMDGDAVPVEVVGKPVSGLWADKEIASYSKDYKIKSVVTVPRGFLVTTYNRNTRRHAFIDEYAGGKRTMIWEASEAKGTSAETIGGGVRVNGTVYFIPERGKNVLKYDTLTGKVSRGASMHDDQKYSVEMCWHAGSAVFGGSNEGGSNTAVYDAETGRKLYDSPLKGLISALASDDNALWWVVAGVGVCNSRGESWPLNASSIAIWSGKPIVGGQADGTIWQLTSGEWTPMLTITASKINRLVVDSRDGSLLVAASNPDTFLRIGAGGEAEILGRWTDQGVYVSGEQFDAYINEGSGDTIIGSRALVAGCKAYRFDLVGEGSTGTTPSAIDYSDTGKLGSGFLWKLAEHGGTVILLNKLFVAGSKSATVKGSTRGQETPYEDGRAAYRWRNNVWSGALDFVVTMHDGHVLTWRIPDAGQRLEGLKPVVT